MNCAEEELFAFFSAFFPVLSHFLVLQGEPVKIFAAPFAVKIDARRKALESLLVQPFDAFENRVDVQPRNRAQCDCAELYKSRYVLFDGLETPGSAYGTAGEVVVMFWAVERKVNAEMFLFAKVKKLVVEQRAVCVDGELQNE